MPALPRGKCPTCERDVALRTGELVREHQGSLIWDAKRRTWTPRSSVCAGSGKKAKR